MVAGRERGREKEKEEERKKERSGGREDWREGGTDTQREILWLLSSSWP